MTVQAQEIRRYPIGVSDFQKLIDESFTHVDKTLLIKDIIDDGSEALLITRPRRFGKTINLSMLYYFFSMQCGEKSNVPLFEKSLLAQRHSTYNVTNWYNGYRFGEVTVYNPWSIINCLNNNGEYQSYWANTSSNELIKKVIIKSSVSLKSELEDLLKGNQVDIEVDTYTNFVNIDTVDSSVWHLLLASGYLTADDSTKVGSRVACQIQIPNLEIQDVFRELIMSWFEEMLGVDKYKKMLSELVAGNVEKFYDLLKGFLLSSVSYFDFKKPEPEQNYHLIVLGLFAGLHQTYDVTSNRESGYGRYDLMIQPKRSHDGLAIIFEFKASKDRGEDLTELACQALKQINNKKYQAGVKDDISKILKIGLAFRGKDVEMKHATQKRQ